MALRDELNRQAGNARKGRRFRSVQRGGRTVHDYASGPDVVVGDQHAVQVGGMGHAPAGPPAADAPQPIGQIPAGNLADLITGQRAYEEQGGRGGPVLGSHMHDSSQEAQVGSNAKGQKFSAIEVGGRKFHVYFTPDGQRIVRELPRQGPTFTPTPA